MALTVALTVGLVGCMNVSDVGDACPMDVPEPDRTASGFWEFPAIVEVNTAFPCEQPVCVALSGSPPYCSRDCVSDVDCPSAFVCRVVTELGPFADKKFCVWRSCFSILECGDVDSFDCFGGYYGPGAPPGLCGPLGGYDLIEEEE